MEGGEDDEWVIRGEGDDGCKLGGRRGGFEGGGET